MTKAPADCLMNNNFFSFFPVQVYAKGKGELNTYFLKTGDSKVNFDDSQHSSKEMSIYSSIHGQPLPNSDSRLIDWNVCLMGRLLQQIVARREARGWARLTPASSSSTMPDPNLWRRDSREQQYVIDEVQEVIKLPDFQTYTNQRDPDTVDLGEAVTSQLFSYVSSVCHMYRKENPFHNFEVSIPTDDFFLVPSHRANYVPDYFSFKARFPCHSVGQQNAESDYCPHGHSIQSQVFH